MINGQYLHCSAEVQNGSAEVQRPVLRLRSIIATEELIMADTDQLAAVRSLPPVTPDAIAEIAQVIAEKIQIDRRIALDDWFLGDITRRGRVLYARTDR